MPEGPEVTIIREDLNGILENQIITQFNILPTSRYSRKAPNNYLYFEEHLPLKVKQISSKGKLIYWCFEKNIYMTNSLGMSGIWSYSKSKHAILEIIYGVNQKIYFVDQRRFGNIAFYKNKKELQEKLNTLGPDLLNDKTLTFNIFKNRLLLHPRWNITKALMDQSVISGIGNYLKSESLYEAKLSPLRTIESLSNDELEALYHACKMKIISSYLDKGVSMKDFVDVDGKKGKHEFKLKVYCKAYDPYGRKVVRITTKDGRTTHWVPEVQK